MPLVYTSSARSSSFSLMKAFASAITLPRLGSNRRSASSNASLASASFSKCTYSCPNSTYAVARVFLLRMRLLTSFSAASKSSIASNTS